MIATLGDGHTSVGPSPYGEYPGIRPRFFPGALGVAEGVYVEELIGRREDAFLAADAPYGKTVTGGDCEIRYIAVPSMAHPDDIDRIDRMIKRRSGCSGRVFLVGEYTEGGAGIPRNFRLTRDISFRVSRTVIVNPEGFDYERGLPPSGGGDEYGGSSGDVIAALDLSVFRDRMVVRPGRSEQFEDRRGRDLVLQRAIELLTGNRAVGGGGDAGILGARHRLFADWLPGACGEFGR